ncbi:hypothetical protein NQZ79_g1162 [Umbelopsis isabellina]|nr:hypothetical protein NQZ79_g1162 [Umbelopsis isabellina]
MVSEVTAGSRVLVTGATGYVGANVVDEFLQAGHVVIGTSRSAKKASNVEKYFKEKYGADRFEIYEISEMEKNGVFDVVVKDVEVVAHVASPILWTPEDAIMQVINPAINGTLNLLKSVHKYGKNVKEVVYTSSLAAAVQLESDSTYVITEKDWNDEAIKGVYKLKEEGQKIDGTSSYYASKTEAEKAFWRFREETKPSFAMTSILPTFCFGTILPPPADDKAVQATSTAKFVADLFSGKNRDPTSHPKPFTTYVHVVDVARAHVLVTQHLDITNGERYILSAGAFSFQEAVDIMREKYPERQNIIIKGDPGNYPKSERFADGSKITRTLGLQYVDFKTTILDNVKGLEDIYKE